MPLPRIVGTNPLLVGTTIERDPSRGFTTTYVYEGDQQSIYGLSRLIRNDQRFLIDDTDKPKFRLILQSPDSPAADQASDYIWTVELLGNDVEHSIYDHPKARALGDAVLATIKMQVKAVEGADPLTASAAADAVDDAEEAIENAAEDEGVGPAGLANALAIFKLLIRESPSYVESQYVLRRTQTIGSRAVITLSFENVNEIWSTSLVNTTEMLPFEVVFSIASIPEPAAQTGYQWGWLKKSPTINQVANGKFTSSQEYWLGQWSTFNYDYIG